jgi:hypothetical protein
MYRLRRVVDQPAGDSILDELGHGPHSPSHYGRPGGKALGDDQAKRLRPAKGHEERERAAE